MIRLVYSNRTECLLDELLTTLDRDRSDPLESRRIVVPNRYLEAYVRFGLAQRCGIASGLGFVRFEELIGQLLAESSDDAVRLVDHWRLLGGVLDVLLSDRPRLEPDLEPVGSYLTSVDDPAGRGLRTTQLARRVTRLFDDYVLHRPDWIRRWRREPPPSPGADPTTDDPTGRWQWSLFHHAWESLVRRGRERGIHWLGLDQLADRGSQALTGGGEPLFAFGLSYVAPLYQQLFARLGRDRDLHVFTLNPCAEFWEDVETDRELRRRLARDRRDLVVGGAALSEEEDPFGLFAGEENLPLRRWGVPGRESMRLLNELTECDFVPRFEVPDAETLLARVQRDILFRSPTVETESPRVPVDSSIRWFGAASPRREAEIVVDDIWREVRASPVDQDRLRFHEIAILVDRGSLDTYRPHLEAAARETGLPLAIHELVASEVHRALDAALRLLDLPFGDLTRPEMLRILTHPSLSFGEAEARRGEWADLAEELGILFGADRRSLAGTHIERDLLTWDQGIRRLVLGACLGYGTRGEPVRTFEWAGEEYLPAAGPTAVDPSRLHFGLAVRTLLAWCRELRSEPKPLSAWIQMVREFLRAQVRESEDGIVDRLLRPLEPLEAAAPDRSVSGRIAASLASTALEGLSASSGTPLTSGVVTSSFLPMRALPFRRVYALGLGEGRFPAPRRRDPLDLRHHSRRGGDVTPEERDRYSFLEAILCARERICLSWVDVDPVTGERLRPSSMIRELMETLRPLVGTRGLEGLTRIPSRTRWGSSPGHPESDDPASPSARLERRARRLGEELRELLGPDSLSRRMDDLFEGIEPGPTHELRELLGYVPIDRLDISPPALEGRHLRQLLECPLHAWGSAVAGLRRSDDESVELRDEEHVRTPPLVMVVARREAFFASLATGREPLVELSERLLEAELSARSAVGRLLELELEVSRSILASWTKAASFLIERSGAVQRRVSIGSAFSHPTGVTELHPPIRLPGLDGAQPGAADAIRLSGTTAPLFGELGAFLVPYHGKLSQVIVPRLLLNPWIDHLLLAAVEGPTARPRPLLVCGPDEGDLLEYRLQPVHSEGALGILGRLATELVTGDHDVLLPLQVAIERGDDLDPAQLTIERIDNRLRTLERRTDLGQCRWGAVPHPESYPLPTAEVALPRLRSRHLPLLQHIDRASR